MIALIRWLVRPLGYLAYVASLVALSGAARLLGERHELGIFSRRLADVLWRYPEPVRPGIRVAWVVWAVLFVVALSPVDPLVTTWDEIVLGGVALAAGWHHLLAARRGER